MNSLRKEINSLLSKIIKRLRQEINRLLSKGMSNIFLKDAKKNSRSQNFNFLGLKNLSPGQFLGSSNSRRIIEF